MKYFLIDSSHQPATIDTARRVLAQFKNWEVPATVKHVGDGFCVDTESVDIRSELPSGVTCVPLKYERVKGFVSRKSANLIASDIKRWGGKVYNLSEAFDDSYIEADVLDDGFFNERIKHFLF